MKRTLLLAMTGMLTLAACGSDKDKPDAKDTTSPTNVTMELSANASDGEVALNEKFTITARAQDDSGSIAKVQLLKDGQLVATDETPADGFIFEQMIASAGSAKYVVKAYDAAGNSATSGEKTVVASANETVGDTTPGNGGDVTDPGTPTPTPPGPGTGNPVDPSVPNPGTGPIGDGTYSEIDGIGFAVSQQLVKSERGLFGEYKDGDKWKTAQNGWLYFAQQPEQITPTVKNATYVKGTDLKVRFAPELATDTVELWWYATTGTKEPTLSEAVTAGKKLASVTGTLDYSYDTTQFANHEATVQWLVVRVLRDNGVKDFAFRAIIPDNEAPQPATINRISAVNQAGSNLFRSDEKGSVETWARGTINLSVDNVSIQDREYGQGATGTRLPIGFESVTYYFVPSDSVKGKDFSDTNLQRRASAVRDVAVAWTNPAKAASTNEGSGNYSAVYDSVQGKITEGVNYRVYALTRDYLGNEVASPTFENVIFDNTGPVVAGGVICDASPLPFVSTEPCKYISDMASVNLDSVVDAGVGIGKSANVTAFGNAGSFVLSSGFVDTNTMGDGKYQIDFGAVTDLLGNPAQGGVKAYEFFVDNTDPVASLQANNPDVFTATLPAGQLVGLTSLGEDTGSGIYQNILFHDLDDTLYGLDYGIAPVELGRNSANPIGNTTKLSANADWVLPTIDYVGDVAPLLGNVFEYNVRSLVVDRAGNAAMAPVENITVDTSAFVNDDGINVNSFPRIGRYDVWQAGNADLRYPDPTSAREIRGVEGLVQDYPGLTHAAVEKASTQAQGGVDFYGRFDEVDWNAISGYLTKSTPYDNSKFVDGLVADALANARLNALRTFVQFGTNTDGGYGKLTPSEKSALEQLGFDVAQLASDSRITEVFRDNKGSALLQNDYIKTATDAEKVIDLFNSDTTVTLVTLTSSNVILTSDGKKTLAQVIREKVSKNSEYYGKFYQDPTPDSKMDKSKGTMPLAQYRNEIEGWLKFQNDGKPESLTERQALAPWLSVGRVLDQQGFYRVDTNLINNIYFYSDDVDFSVPGTTNEYAQYNPYITGYWDAIGFIVRDGKGNYDYGAELIKRQKEK